MIEGVISIISILSATVISFINIMISEKRRKHDIYHTEYFREKQEVADTISEFMKVSSTGKLRVFMRRAYAVNVNEAVDEFCSEIDNYNDMLTFHTFRVLAITEIHDDSIFTDRIMSYRSDYHDSLDLIKDIKAACSQKNESEASKQYITRLRTDLENRMEKLHNIENIISKKMQDILVNYSKRVK